MDVGETRALPLSELVPRWQRYHDDLLLHDADGPTECLVRSGELVVAAEQADRASVLLRRWLDRVENSAELRLARLRLRPAERERCVQIAADLAGELPEMAANHVHIGSPVVFGTPVMFGAPVVFGTGSEASPAESLFTPRAELWQPPVTVAVLDTGLDPHPWFAGRSWLSEWGLAPEVLDADDDLGQDRQAGHGTFVTGVVLQHAPGVTVRHHRVLSSLGISDDVTVVAGLRRVRHTAVARGEHIDVVLLTSGCHTADDRCPPLLRREVGRYAEAVVVAAAGNGAVDRPFWPAALPEAVGVGATDQLGRRAAFSNFGGWVDAAAPGIDVVSSYVRLRPAAERSLPDTEHREYGLARWSGTSFAAPVLAAKIASLLHSGHSASAARTHACRAHPQPR